MRFPKSLKANDIIGVTAPSAGIVKEEKTIRLNAARQNIENLGFRYVETESVRKCDNGRSSSGKKRAEEFMKLWKNSEVGAIIMATGGDFLVEMLEYLNWEELRNIEPKWIQGYSDITGLSFLITTILDTATIYGDNVKSYGMRKLYKNLTDSFEIMRGNELVQKSFGMCENIETVIEDTDPFAGYLLTKKNEWKIINHEKRNINFIGRSLGGCFDVIINLIGTKYDKIGDYIEKYKEDGIIWFFDIYEMTSSQIYLHLWQMKNAGHFKYCKGILFGRPLMVREEYDMKYYDAIKQALEELDVPIIYDVDIGHIPPQMPIVNGAILEINYDEGECKITTRLR